MSLLRELLADVMHQIWAKWMNYLFSVSVQNEDGTWTIPKEFAERWQRQVNTKYQDLSEKEKQSDRHQADKVLATVINSKEDPFWVLNDQITIEVSNLNKRIVELGHTTMEYRNLRQSGLSEKEVAKLWNL